MANSRPNKRSFSVIELGMSPSNATTGAWTLQLSAGKITLNKAAAATTSVVNIPIKKDADAGAEDKKVASVAFEYSVATAALSAAPTAVLNINTVNPTTGALTSSTVAGTLTFAGTNTVGTAVGDYIATFAITTPVQLADTDSAFLTVTMNEAATSVLNLNGVKIDYTG